MLSSGRAYGGCLRKLSRRRRGVPARFRIPVFSPRSDRGRQRRLSARRIGANGTATRAEGRRRLTWLKVATVAFSEALPRIDCQWALAEDRLEILVSIAAPGGN